jgi:hypothetical protein
MRVVVPAAHVELGGGWGVVDLSPACLEEVGGGGAAVWQGRGSAASGKGAV